MEELDLKHLAPYLPYKLRLMHGGINGENKVMNTGQGSSCNWVGISSVIKWQKRDKLKALPILKPLSDLKKPIDIFVSNVTYEQHLRLRRDKETCLWGASVTTQPLLFNYPDIDYKTMNTMFSWHFDVFGLIPKGLAIDINTLEEKD